MICVECSKAPSASLPPLPPSNHPVRSQVSYAGAKHATAYHLTILKAWKPLLLELYFRRDTIQDPRAIAEDTAVIMACHSTAPTARRLQLPISLPPCMQPQTDMHLRYFSPLQPPADIVQSPLSSFIRTLKRFRRNAARHRKSKHKTKDTGSLLCERRLVLPPIEFVQHTPNQSARRTSSVSSRPRRTRPWPA